ncbi:MAG: YkgJ family cysteine cluster protein [Cytophagaceae bacterium]|nr:YkgJ family cysteine cluster protein [Cytophagaceae bacterium]
MTEEISKLCVTCGMCCDGSLFRHGHLFDQEDIDLAKGLGLEVVENEGFKMPCKFFDGKCSIWTSEKPKICEKYFCKPLKRYLNGDIDFDEASIKVKNLITVKEKMLIESRQFEEFNGFTLVQVCEKLDNCTPGNLKKYGFLHLIRLDLNTKLRNFFD